MLNIKKIQIKVLISRKVLNFLFQIVILKQKFFLIQCLLTKKVCTRYIFKKVKMLLKLVCFFKSFCLKAYVQFKFTYKKTFLSSTSSGYIITNVRQMHFFFNKMHNVLFTRVLSHSIRFRSLYGPNYRTNLAQNYAWACLRLLSVSRPRCVTCEYVPRSYGISFNTK